MVLIIFYKHPYSGITDRIIFKYLQAIIKIFSQHCKKPRIGSAMPDSWSYYICTFDTILISTLYIMINCNVIKLYAIIMIGKTTNWWIQDETFRANAPLPHFVEQPYLLLIRLSFSRSRGLVAANSSPLEI